MLQYQDPDVRSRLLEGKFGLEKESLRVDAEGKMAHTPHPFPNDDHITRDFCENQTEINTPVADSAQEAVEMLWGYTRQMHRSMREQGQGEVLWPFSNPPVLQGEEDVPIASFLGGRASKTDYRRYLSDKYGRYKMTFSGIHVNYSFSEELLRADFALSGQRDFTEYRNHFYVKLAEQAAAYGWLLTMLTAASPVMDGSYFESGAERTDIFTGMSSVRCSELGYWNFFAPVFDYTDIRRYADGMRSYVDQHLLTSPTELYYPIRLKPRGRNVLRVLHDQGVDHIELRMFDLNPLCPEGIELRDVQFAQLLLVWLACVPHLSLGHEDQVQAVQNFKSAARYDLSTVHILMPGGIVGRGDEMALAVLRQMRQFFTRQVPDLQAVKVIDFEMGKLLHPERRYAVQVRRRFSGTFAEKGLALAKERQQQA